MPAVTPRRTLLGDIYSLDPSVWTSFEQSKRVHATGEHALLSSVLRGETDCYDRDWRKAVFRLLDVKFGEMGGNIDQKEDRLDVKILPVRVATCLRPEYPW